MKYKIKMQLEDDVYGLLTPYSVNKSNANCFLSTSLNGKVVKSEVE